MTRVRDLHASPPRRPVSAGASPAWSANDASPGGGLSWRRQLGGGGFGSRVGVPPATAAWGGTGTIGQASLSSHPVTGGLDSPGAGRFTQGFGLKKDDHVVCTGWLAKTSSLDPPKASWRRKWFTLLPDRLCFSSDKNKAHELSANLLLNNISVTITPDGRRVPMVHHLERSVALEMSAERERGCIFTITCGTKVHVMAADHPNTARTWVRQVIATWTAHQGREYKEKWPSLELFPEPLSAQPSREALSAQPSYEEIEYVVTVRTGDRKDAGTEASVAIELLGSSGQSSGKQFLRDSAENDVPFGVGQVDTFRFVCPDLGELQLLRLFYDGMGNRSDWMLEDIQVRRGSDGVSWDFPFRDWLRLADGQHEVLEREITPSTNNHLVPYNVVIKTGDMRSAGTDANVHLVMYARDGRWGAKHVFSHQHNDFPRGEEVRLTFSDSDVGPPAEIVIGHDGTGSHPQWFLEWVSITHLPTGKQAFFPCNAWLGGDNKSEARLQVVRGDTGGSRTYNLQVVTSDVKGAGTDADVYVELQGRNGSTGRMQLPSRPEHFERGGSDFFSVTGVDVGKVARLIIGHNNRGPSPGWHLDYCALTSNGSLDKIYFPCGEWLASFAPDGKLERMLTGTDTNPRDGLVQYQVVFYTSNLKGAGTDANVRCQLFGVDGSSDDTALRAGLDAFERGREDAFTITCMNLGELEKIRVEHDNAGDAQSWHLKKVVVSGKALRSGPVTFLCNQWLKSGELSVELKPMKKRHGRTADALYSVRLHTGSAKGAGTDANVSMQIYGEDDMKTSILSLQGSGHESLQRGHVDEFELEAEDVGRIDKVRIWHDGAGPASAWYLDMVEVSVESRSAVEGSPQSVVCLCQSWLDDDSGTERTLHPATRATHVCTYVITVITSDRKGAGTDSNISLELRGDAGCSGFYDLMAEGNTFRRGKVDEFRIRTLGVGAMHELCIRSDGSGPAPAWHLQEVSVTDSAEGGAVNFPAFRWLDEKSGLEAVLKSDVAGNAVVDYGVKLYTGRMRGAGTDAHVSLELIGDDGSSTGPRELQTGPEEFERGSVDQFLLRLPSVKNIQALRIWHDNTGLGSSWYLECAEVTDASTGTTFHFDARCWLSAAEGLERTLPASLQDGRDVQQTDYEVTFYTGSVRQAGTDANVSVELRGTSGSTGTLRIPAGLEAFDRASKDSFRLRAARVGAFQSLTVWHDNYGSEPSWFLEGVEVMDAKGATDGPTGTNVPVYFPCQQWLSAERGSLKVTLEAGHEKRGEERVAYAMSIFTGTQRGADTTGDVEVELVGEVGRSGAQMLHAGETSFARGKRDDFVLSLPYLGVLKEVLVRQDGKGEHPDWFLEKVEVVDEQHSDRYIFYANTWLNAAHGLETVLKSARDVEPDAVEYTVTLVTGSMRGAGTDANVHVHLYGEAKSSGARKLDIPGHDPFERGQTDQFTLTLPHLGLLQKMEVWHDNFGPYPDWFIDKIEVLDGKTSDKYFFKAGCWLSSSTSLSKTISASLAQPQSPTREYIVRVRTSDMRGAGTTANVSIELVGEETSSKSTKLLAGNQEEVFQRGACDEFRLQLPPLGTLTEATLVSDDFGSSPAWHLEQVELVEAQTGEITYFSGQSWLSKEAGLSMTMKASLQNPRERRRKYRVTVFTSDKRGASTDGNIYVDLIGEAARYGPLHLDDDRELFARNGKDEFTYELPFLGALQEIKVRHDGSGSNPKWHLFSVEVDDLQTGDRWFFRSDRWFSATAGLSHRLSATLQDPRSALQNYEVVVRTSDIKGAGTDARILIELYGETATSGSLSLEPPSASTEVFQRGSVDKFTVTTPSLGRITEVVVGHDSRLRWHLEQLEVTDVKTHQKYFFIANRWLSQDEGDGKTKVSLPALLEDPREAFCKYQIVLHTSALPGAGTDAAILCQLGGDKGETGPLSLEPKGPGQLGRGCVDTWVLQAGDVGNLQYIVLGHDNSGAEPAWHLSHAEVTSLTHGDKAVFPCQDWFARGYGDGKIKRTLWAEGFTPPTDATWRVDVVTGKQNNAGTEAGVQVELVGRSGSVAGPFPLRPEDGGSFRPATTDSFTITGPAVGDLAAIKVQHDNTGTDPAWFLEAITVTEVSSKAVWHFPCNSWLSEEGGLARRLESLPKGAEQPEMEYAIEVVTAQQEGAGTDAGVFLILHGQTGSSERLELKEEGEGGSDPFQPGCHDKFVRTMRHLGELHRATLGHDNKGAYADWLPEQVVVIDQYSGAEYVFPCGKWISKAKGLQLELLPEAGDTAARAGSTAKKGKERRKYRVSVHTSNIGGAESEGRVFVELFGASGSSGLQMLGSRKTLFRRGKVESFKIPGADVGRMQRLAIGRKETTGAPGWHIDKVVVTNLDNKASASFLFGTWFEANESGVMEREATAADGARDETGDDNVEYTVWVNTAIASDPRMDGAVVTLQMIGSLGVWGPQTLPTGPEDFQPDGSDLFSFDTTDLGDLTEVRLRVNEKEGQLRPLLWLLDSVEVMRSSDERTWYFPGTSQPGVPVTVRSDDVAETALYVSELGPPSSHPSVTGLEAPPLPMGGYQLTVATSSLPFAGTNAKIAVELIGARGSSSRKPLEQSRQQLQRGGVDLFNRPFHDTPNLGPLQSLRVYSDGHGLCPAWHPKSVTVMSLGTGEIWTFDLNAWVHRRQQVKDFKVATYMGPPNNLAT